MSNQDDERIQHHLTKEDREWMKRRMKERGVGARALGASIGQTRQAIYLLLNGTTKATYDWALIVSALGGTPPSGTPPITDERLREFVRRWPEFSEDDKRLAEAIARRFGAKKP